MSSDFISQLRDLVAQNLPRIDVAAVHTGAHLTYDLGLDSIELMQLLVLLETQAGYQIPDYALDADKLQTVADLQQLLCTQEQDTVGEPELDVKVHCVVSCLCHSIKQQGLDHRPFYFGVWDAEVFIDAQHQLRYHSDKVDHDFFIRWYQRLYGAKVTQWYDHGLSKQNNIDTLSAMLQHRPDWQQLMVMLDMYRLPERENRFALDPFPHYVLLENATSDEDLWMWDPDFRWEGNLKRERVMQAIASPAVAGGYTLDTRPLHAPYAADIDAYFNACFNPQQNHLTDAVETIIQHHLPGGAQAPTQLGKALAELPVLAIRKYAYEHGLAFFWRELNQPAQEFERWCDAIEILVKGFDKLLYQANKWAMTQTGADLEQLLELVAEQNRRELNIKQAVREARDQWRKQAFTDHRNAELNPA
ncbi:DUF6005 family protein [Gilvimarinus sp. DA14]|uniref:DUF6005 family protein n=1 Tax=Gilvimarinus sp. DA14 TaxID=2956798 RepID=UPI0020B7B6BD|nr:DUF6005 family protein [Gilvimarinus sp. DA14]UTF61543.1 acyl carrier protein [Gilvimarinus sp. DA14]